VEEDYTEHSNTIVGLLMDDLKINKFNITYIREEVN